MKCQEVERRLTEDLYGAFALREVRRHLEQCSPCRAFSRQLEEIESLKDSLSSCAHAPADLPIRVSKGFFRARTRRMILRVVLPLAVVLAVTAAERWINEASPRAAGETGIRAADTPSIRDWEEMGAGWESKLELERLASQTPRYLEVVVSDPTVGPVIVQLPARIEVRRSDPGREYLAYVSH